MRAREASGKQPVTIEADRTITEAAQLLNRAAVGAIVVVDHDQPVGIVTDRDLAIRAVARRLPPDSRIDSVMSTNLVTLAADADIHEAMAIFNTHPIRRIPLVEAGRMVGMITVDDALIVVAGHLNQLLRGVTGQVIFGHPEPGELATTSPSEPVAG